MFVRRERFSLDLAGEECVLGERTWLMGVLNVTPDSFSDGGRASNLDAALRLGLELAEDGADVLDVGGESTRPGAAAISASEERSRVVPVIEGLVRRGVARVSVDTTKAEVADAALDVGASIVNDVSALSFDAEMASLVARRGAAAVLMHLRGTFGEMHRSPLYADVMGEIVSELGARVAAAVAAGIPRRKLLVDPGVGFSKTAAHSLEALRRLHELAALGCPVLVGPSRKSFIGAVLDVPVHGRLLGTASAVAAAVLGGAHVVRVHDVREMREVARIADASLEAGFGAQAA
jgi:dihydropteroate synthase